MAYGFASAASAAAKAPSAARTAGRTVRSALGTLYSKALGSGPAWTKALQGLGVAAAGLQVMGGIQQARESRQMFNEIEGAVIPRAEEVYAKMLQSQEVSQRMANMDPETLDSLKWILSGQSPPDLTENDIMVGATPTNAGVTDAEMRAAVAAMMGG